MLGDFDSVAPPNDSGAPGLPRHRIGPPDHGQPFVISAIGEQGVGSRHRQLVWVHAAVFLSSLAGLGITQRS